MPVKVTKAGRQFKVTHGGKTSAKGTTKAKAQAQANLLRGIEHGWVPTGNPARAAGAPKPRPKAAPHRRNKR